MQRPSWRVQSVNFTYVECKVNCIYYSTSSFPPPLMGEDRKNVLYLWNSLRKAGAGMDTSTLYPVYVRGGQKVGTSPFDVMLCSETLKSSVQAVAPL